MDEQKDIQKQDNMAEPEMNAEALPQQPTLEAADDDDDYVATAEEMEAFIRERREKEKEENKEDRENKTDVFGEYAAPENSIDPYLDPDPTLPWVK